MRIASVLSVAFLLALSLSACDDDITDEDTGPGVDGTIVRYGVDE